MKILVILLFAFFINLANAEEQDLVVVMPLAEDVYPEDAVDSMKLRANLHNMMFVASQPLSDQLKAMGVEDVRLLEIYQFCNPLIAYEMVKYNSIFAAYMPCRIALVEEEDGSIVLMMLNLEPLLSMLPEDLQELGNNVNNSLLDIMQAGANGEL